MYVLWQYSDVSALECNHIVVSEKWNGAIFKRILKKTTHHHTEVGNHLLTDTDPIKAFTIILIIIIY